MKKKEEKKKKRERERERDPKLRVKTFKMPGHIRLKGYRSQ